MGLNKANDANAGPEHLSDALDRLRPAEIRPAEIIEFYIIESYNKTPSHNTGHGTGAHWH